MTHYELTQHAKGKTSPMVAKYLERAKRRLAEGIQYNAEFTPHIDPEAKLRFRYDDSRFRWVERAGDGLRFVGKVHEITSDGDGDGDGNRPYIYRALIDHRGWYMDAFQDNLAWGEVYQLPARDGKARYVPAISTKDDECDGAILDFHSVTGDLRDAIHWADSMAKRFAEDEREYQARESAKERIEENREAISKLYADFKTLAKETRANCDRLTGMDAIKDLIRAEYRRVRRHVRKLRAEIGELEEDFWSIEPGY